MSYEAITAEILKINSKITEAVGHFARIDERGDVSATSDTKLHFMVKNWYIQYCTQDRAQRLMSVIDRLGLDNEDPDLVSMLMMMVAAVHRRQWHSHYDTLCAARHHRDMCIKSHKGTSSPYPYSEKEKLALDDLIGYCLDAIDVHNQFIDAGIEPEYMGRCMYAFLNNFDHTLEGRCEAMSMFHGMQSRYYLKKYMSLITDLVNPIPEKNVKDEMDLIADWVCREIGNLQFYQLEQHCHAMLDFCEDNEMGWMLSRDTGLIDSVYSAVYGMCSIAM